MNDTAGTVRLIRGTPIASATWSAGVGGPGVSMANDPSAALYATVYRSNCSSTQTFGSQSPQQRGTPGQARGCFPYALSSIPANFEDISATGTILLATASGTTGNTGNSPVTLPAPFTYLGTPYTTINISMCGFTTFGKPLASAYDQFNDVNPSTTDPNGVLAVFWDRLQRNTTGNLLMQRRSNYTIISWQDFGLYLASSCHLNFQQKLFDDGSIEFHYGAMTPSSFDTSNYTSGSSATAWIETMDGTAALPISVNTAFGILPNTAYRFTPY
jgi:hypothetical protein